jgi:ion channel-forming bestrophin family protein
MIVSFSKSPFKRFFGIVFWNKWPLIFYTVCAVGAYILCVTFDFKQYVLPAVPVSVLGGALAIFLGFRNSSAYDRWWEARKIWGALVNNSRSFGMEVLTYAKTQHRDDKQMQEWKDVTIRRHIAWVYALRSHLRKESFCEVLPSYLSKEDMESLKGAKNIPTQLMLQQGKEIAVAFEKDWIEEFRFNALIGTLKKFYDDQGKSERIKNTIFPYYYNYFTRFFLQLFTLCLPFALVGLLGNYLMIPVSVLISFAFTILNKTGEITETPFEGRAADTPLSAICRTIEIDLLQMIGEENIPEAQGAIEGKFGVKYQP